MSSNSIIVVGAGAAGLAATRELSRAGRQVVVVEARGRIGGRIFTRHDPSCPVPIELGAEFVHGKSPEIMQLARAANLDLYEISERHWYFAPEGKLSKSHDFWQNIEKLMHDMKSAEADETLRQFLHSLQDDEDTRRAKSMVTRYVEGFHAASIDRIGIRGLVKANEAADSIEGDRAFRFLDGYESLVQALCAEAESFGAKVHLNEIVKEIHWGSDRVRVVCSPDLSLIADAVLITLPLGVLQTDPFRGGVQFLPSLPESKLAAINQLVMGNVFKINLLFRERFWESAKVWDEEARVVSFHDAAFFHFPELAFPTWWTQLPIRAPVLVGWVGGAQADRLIARVGESSRDYAQPSESDRVTVESPLIEEALSSLSRIFNLPCQSLRDLTKAAYLHDWRVDPFSRGAYGYLPVGGLDAQLELAQPIGNGLFFAGEATSVGHIGTVHGAIQSGQRAAREILAHRD